MKSFGILEKKKKKGFDAIVKKGLMKLFFKIFFI